MKGRLNLFRRNLTKLWAVKYFFLSPPVSISSYNLFYYIMETFGWIIFLRYIADFWIYSRDSGVSRAVIPYFF